MSVVADLKDTSDTPGDESGRAPLIGRGSRRYGSDGDLQAPISGGEQNSAAERIAEDGLVSVRLRSRSTDADGGSERTERHDESSVQARDEDDSKEKCGWVYCYKKLLDQLPQIGDDSAEEGSAEFEESLRYGAWQIVQLIIPVVICMAVVVLLQLTIAVYYTGPQAKLLYLPYSEDNSSGGINFLFGIVNAIVFVALVLVMTVILVLLFKYRCDRALFVWLFVASGSLLFFIASLYFVEILLIRDLVIDWFTFILVIWNYGCLGLVVIHWKGPLRVQQAYLIVCSALVATVLIRYIPDWTTWIILAAISVYDLFAVLCKKGPLRILVETAKERGEINFPSLIYSSTMMWLVSMADNGKKSDSSNKKSSSRDREPLPKGRPQKRTSSSSEEEGGGENSDDEDDETEEARLVARQLNAGDEDSSIEDRRSRSPQGEDEEDDKEEKRGFKLGLGDFIFYSVLVGKAAHQSNGDWVIISSCFVAILIGLCVTSLILGIVRRALPALPFSIFFGLIFYFASQYVISPYVQVLNVNQVFI